MNNLFLPYLEQAKNNSSNSSMNFDINQATEEKETGKKYLFGCASSDSIDSYDSKFPLKILQSFEKDFKTKNIIVETYHQNENGYKFIYAIGNVIDAYIQNLNGVNKLFIKVEINQRSPMAQWIWEVVLKPDLAKGEPEKLGFSIDTRITEQHYEMIDGRMIEVYDVGRLVRVAVLEAPSNPDAYAIAVTRSIKENKQGDLVKIVFNNIENKENVLMENIVEQTVEETKTEVVEPVVEPVVEATEIRIEDVAVKEVKEVETEVKDNETVEVRAIDETNNIDSIAEEAVERVADITENVIADVVNDAASQVHEDCPYCKVNIAKIIEAIKAIVPTANLVTNTYETVEVRSIADVEKSLNENLESNLKSVEKVVVRSILESFETKTKGLTELVNSTINGLTEKLNEGMNVVNDKILSLNNLMDVIANQPVSAPARQVNISSTQIRGKQEVAEQSIEQICKSYLEG